MINYTGKIKVLYMKQVMYCKMVHIGDKRIGSVLTTAVIALVIFKLAIGSSHMKRHDSYYARLSKDLKDLARKDFQTMVTLKSSTKKWQLEGQARPFVNVVAK